MPPIIINSIQSGTSGSNNNNTVSSLTLTTTKTSNYIALTGQRVVCDTSSSSFTVTTPFSGRFGVLDKIGTSYLNGFGTNPLTIQAAGSTTIMGDTSLLLDVGALSVEFELLGTDWRIVSSTNLDDDDANNNNSPLIFDQIATPPTPSTGKTAIYGKNDGKIYYFPAGGSETVVPDGVRGREVLTANRTYYIRTDGNDSNTGLTNTAGGAFLTIQKFVDIAASLDLSIYNVTGQIGAGIYTFTSSSPLLLRGTVVSGKVIIKGDSTTPANVKIKGSGAFNYTGVITSAVSSETGSYIFDGLNFNGGGTGNAGDVYISAPFNLRFKNCLFDGSSYLVRIYIETGCKAYFENNMLGAGSYYAFVQAYGTGTYFEFTSIGSTQIASGLVFTTFVLLDFLASGVKAYAHTVSGSASGSKYLILRGAAGYALDTLPGSTPGSISIGGTIY